MNYAVPKRVAVIVRDAAVRATICSILQEHDFETVSFDEGDHFLYYHNRTTLRFDAFVHDMGSNDAVEMITKIKSLQPYANVVYIARVSGGFIRERVTVAGGIPVDMQNTLQVIPITLKQELGMEE